MAKIGILDLNTATMCRPLNLKRLVLFFDKLYIVKQSLNEAKNAFETKRRTPKGITRFIDDRGIETFSSHPPKNFFSSHQNYQWNLMEIDFLANSGIIEFEDLHELIVEEDTERAKSKTFDRLGFEQSSKKHWDSFPYSNCRALAIIKGNRGIEAFPIYSYEPKYRDLGKKEEVLKFTLSKIPEPSENTSWEQIMDFRKNPENMTKYFRLIKWMNEVARKNIPLNEVEEEYKSLYLDYADQYRIHKMKANQGFLEILVTAGIDVLSDQLGIGTIRTSLFSIWKHHLNLIESESKFPGREIAYIYKAQNLSAKNSFG